MHHLNFEIISCPPTNHFDVVELPQSNPEQVVYASYFITENYLINQRSFVKLQRESCGTRTMSEIT